MRLIRLLKYDLAKEVSEWVAESIISTTQAESICARYGVDYHDQNKHSYGYFILVSLAYLFFGLALITLIGANWEGIPRAVRMLGLVALTFGTNAFGVYKAVNRQYAAAIGSFFLGGLFYGASIMLIAQIYHIGEHFPDGIYWWAAGVLPLALLMESTLLMLLSASLGFIWFFTETAQDFYPLSFPLLLAAMAWHCFRIKQSNLLFMLLVAGLAFWLEYSFSWLIGDWQRFNVGADNVSLGVGTFMVFYAMSKWLLESTKNIYADYGTLLAAWTLRFTMITLLILSFEGSWKDLIGAEWRLPSLSLILAVVLSSASIWMVHSAGKPVVAISALSVFYLAALFSLMGLEDRQYAIVYQVIDNIALIASGIWLIVRGIDHGISHYFFLGIGVILVTGLLRYIDLVGDYIGAALLFSVFAVILLSAAKYWKSRRSKQEAAL